MSYKDKKIEPSDILSIDQYTAERKTIRKNLVAIKKYYTHSLYPGGLKSKVFKDIIENKPEYVIEEAVKGMLPKNKLGKKIFKKLKVYKGDNHPHESQEPKIWEPKI